MKNQTYISRGKKPYQQYQFRCIIPKDLKDIFSTREFRLSLKSSLYSESKVRAIKKTFEKDGSIHPNAVNSLMRVVTGVHSGRYGWMNKNNPKVPQNYAREEDETLQEGMTSSVARMSAIVLKKRVVGYGNRVEGSTDVGQKLDYLSKQISAVGGIALVACSLSGEGLLSKGAIFTSLFSSNEPDENLDTLFEELC